MLTCVCVCVCVLVLNGIPPTQGHHHSLTLLMFGSKCRLQRPMHCWSVRPSQLRAISAQRPTPKVLTNSISLASSSGVHLSRRMLGFTCSSGAKAPQNVQNRHH